MDLPEAFSSLVAQVGWFKGLFTFFFFGAHFVIYTMYTGRLRDRQNEIDRLAQDNREYRERFLAITDASFNYDSSKKKIRQRKGGK